MSATVPAELPSTSNSPRWSTQDRSFGPASGSQTMLRLPRAPGPIRCPREPGPHPSKTRRMMKSSTSLFGISMRPHDAVLMGLWHTDPTDPQTVQHRDGQHQGRGRRGERPRMRLSNQLRPSLFKSQKSPLSPPIGGKEDTSPTSPTQALLLCEPASPFDGKRSVFSLLHHLVLSSCPSTGSD